MLSSLKNICQPQIGTWAFKAQGGEEKEKNKKRKDLRTCSFVVNERESTVETLINVDSHF